MNEICRTVTQCNTVSLTNILINVNNRAIKKVHSDDTPTYNVKNKIKDITKLVEKLDLKRKKKTRDYK